MLPFNLEIQKHLPTQKSFLNKNLKIIKEICILGLLSSDSDLREKSVGIHSQLGVDQSCIQTLYAGDRRLGQQSGPVSKKNTNNPLTVCNRAQYRAQQDLENHLSIIQALFLKDWRVRRKSRQGKSKGGRLMFNGHLSSCSTSMT